MVLQNLALESLTPSVKAASLMSYCQGTMVCLNICSLVRFHMCSLVVNVDCLWKAMFWVSWCVLSWWLVVIFHPSKTYSPILGKQWCPRICCCALGLYCVSLVFGCVLLRVFFLFFFNFVMKPEWQPSTRVKNQIWLQVREHSRQHFLELCYVLATY
jgi:hypothetical protein